MQPYRPRSHISLCKLIIIAAPYLIGMLACSCSPQLPPSCCFAKSAPTSNNVPWLFSLMDCLTLRLPISWVSQSAAPPTGQNSFVTLVMLFPRAPCLLDAPEYSPRQSYTFSPIFSRTIPSFTSMESCSGSPSSMTYQSPSRSFVATCTMPI